MSGYILAFDFGLKHIGVAVGQAITMSATPVATLTAVDGRPSWSEVAAVVSQWQPVQLLVGLPLNMDDSESDMSARARHFASRLGSETGIAVALVDERLTSFEARSVDDGNNHAVAAQLIAETWLRESR